LVVAGRRCQNLVDAVVKRKQLRCLLSAPGPSCQGAALHLQPILIPVSRLTCAYSLLSPLEWGLASPRFGTSWTTPVLKVWSSIAVPPSRKTRFQTITSSPYSQGPLICSMRSATWAELTIVDLQRDTGRADLACFLQDMQRCLSFTL
jgi:hypothetical protein